MSGLLEVYKNDLKDSLEELEAEVMRLREAVEKGVYPDAAEHSDHAVRVLLDIIEAAHQADIAANWVYS